jgi:hypothetical protein
MHCTLATLCASFLAGHHALHVGNTLCIILGWSPCTARWQHSVHHSWLVTMHCTLATICASHMHAMLPARLRFHHATRCLLLTWPCQAVAQSSAAQHYCQCAQHNQPKPFHRNPTNATTPNQHHNKLPPAHLEKLCPKPCCSTQLVATQHTIRQH